MLSSLQYDPTGAAYAVPVSNAASLQVQQQYAAAALLGVTPYIGDYSTMDLSSAGQLSIKIPC